MAQQRASIPKFGDWTNNNDAYTVYFARAKANRGGNFINPNDPNENPGMFPDPSPAPPSRPQQKEPTGRGAHKARSSREDTEFRQFSNSPARSYKGGPGTGTGNGSPHPGRGSGRSPMTRGGSERSVDHSPSHQKNQARPTGKGNGSPVSHGKGSNERNQGTPGSRMNPNTRGTGTPQRDVGIPPFGQWELAQEFTSRFEKHRDANNVPAPSNYTKVNQNADDHVKFSRRSCFSWWKN